MKKSKYFKPAELACHCCNRVIINDNLIDLLDQIRDAVGEPVYVTSGYRCVSHNMKVGGAKKSQHSLGNAADIHVKSLTPKQLHDFIEEHFDPPGLGLYPNFVHVDVRHGKKARWHG